MYYYKSMSAERPGSQPEAKTAAVIDHIGPYQVRLLDQSLIHKTVNQLALLGNQIPQVTYTAADLLADRKGDRVLHGKWDHSLALMDDDVPIGFVMSYERAAEDNDMHPDNTLYISELAIDEAHQRQGLARKLLDSFFTFNNDRRFLYLDGQLNYSLQTNSAEWNKHVRELYESFGFRQRATKSYDNRTDIVMGTTITPA